MAGVRVIDLCARCGRQRHGPTAGCGEIDAYWSRGAPLPRDGWYPTQRTAGWYLYGWALPNAVISFIPTTETPI
jgi:hypothetical protein